MAHLNQGPSNANSRHGSYTCSTRCQQGIFTHHRVTGLNQNDKCNKSSKTNSLQANYAWDHLSTQPWSRWATATENPAVTPVSWKQGAEGMLHTGSLKLETWKVSLPFWWLLIYAATFKRSGFGVNNMTAWIHSALFQQFSCVNLFNRLCILLTIESPEPLQPTWGLLLIISEVLEAEGIGTSPNNVNVTLRSISVNKN